ncbi:YoaK family protein [Flavobacterium sp.]|uniref:YoaK family protein n=1 Tax=Flavobacterium sp. TaxID=239 RepID=UPI003D6C0210
MFRHKGKTRTLKHNLRIASLLSFVAGIVNTTGFLAIQRLTTNVTGHFAYLIEEVFKFEFWKGFIFFLYIFFFFLGSFVSNLFIELISKNSNKLSYTVPIFIESAILFLTAIFGQFLILESPNSFAFILLFAMGLQNSLVTSISNSKVRTTHLTGLFTDLGIELSQLFFYTQEDQQLKLYSSIKLRLTIINFFFLGGIIGAILYSQINLYTLIFAGLILICAGVYDSIKLKWILLKRKRMR